MEQSELAKKFFSEVVIGWMLGDLENMVKVDPVNSGPGNLNFPIVLYLFSCIEFLGLLTSQTFIPSSDDYYTKRRIWSYMNDFFKDEHLFQIKPYEASFVSVFRNGLSHEFFAKAAGVSRKTEILMSYNSQLKCLVLDADEFYLAFKASIDSLKTAIDSNRDKFTDTMLARYNDLQASNLLKAVSNDVSTKTHTTSSNPSVAQPVDQKKYDHITLRTNKVKL